MKHYGKKVYDGSADVKSETIGKYVCPTCHKESVLIRRRGLGFQSILSVCDSGHTCLMAKALYEKYHVGDRIRLYESTFGKEAVIRLDSYCEGVIVNSYPSITDYQFDFIVDRCVMNNNEIKSPAWIIGHLHRGIRHSSAEVKLLKKAEKPISFEQLSLRLSPS